MIIDIPSVAIKVEDLLDKKSILPLPFQDTIKRECGHLILVDEMLDSMSYRPHVKKMAFNILNLESDTNIKVEPSNMEIAVKFIEKMISEAKKSPSRYALELFASLNNLIDEMFSNPYISETSQVLTTFIKNFQRFSRHFLELKMDEMD